MPGEVPKIPQPRDHKAKICLWADLDVHKSEEIKEAASMEEVKIILANHFSLSDYKENPRSAALLDLYFYATQHALNHNFSKEQLSAFFSIVKKTHMVCVETPFGNVEQCYDYFRELVLCHAVLRPPWSVNIFTHEHVRLIIDYVVNTYFRHFKLYKYVFTPLVRLDLSMTYDGMPEEEPQAQEEELNLIAEETEGGVQQDQEQPVTDGGDPEKPPSPEEEESETTKELRKLITAQLNEELSKLRISLSDQIQQNNESLQKKLSLADAPGSGKGRTSSKGKKK
ncbi:cilia- and flagella-associated protein 119-like [Diadema antillarum]|uniref:cilia- and flagella-associated protein 119-like n=1 Tax=Diadema antillarum TaxID=105358 RepID=UPI003A8A4312